MKKYSGQIATELAVMAGLVITAIVGIWFILILSYTYFICDHLSYEFLICRNSIQYKNQIEIKSNENLCLSELNLKLKKLYLKPIVVNQSSKNIKIFIPLKWKIYVEKKY